MVVTVVVYVVVHLSCIMLRSLFELHDRGRKGVYGSRDWVLIESEWQFEFSWEFLLFLSIPCHFFCE